MNLIIHKNLTINNLYQNKWILVSLVRKYIYRTPVNFFLILLRRDLMPEQVLQGHCSGRTAAGDGKACDPHHHGPDVLQQEK